MPNFASIDLYKPFQEEEEERTFMSSHVAMTTIRPFVMVLHEILNVDR